MSNFQTNFINDIKIRNINFAGDLSWKIINSLDQGMVLHHENQIIYINDGAKNILNIQSTDDLSGKSIFDFAHKNYHRTIKLFLNKFRRFPDTVMDSIEIKLFRMDGGLIDVEVKTSSLYYENNLLFLTVFKNIYKKKQIDSEIHKFLMAINQNPASIVLTDKSGNIEYVNSKFLEETGFNLKEVIGKTPRILKSGLTTDQNYADLWKTILSGKRWVGEMHNKRKNGEFYWERTSISPIFDDQEKITNFVAVKENITERKKIERLKEDTEQLLRHDLKNMLNGILGMSGLFMLSENITQKEIKEWSTAMHDSGKKMLSAINTSFDFYMMEIGSYVCKTDELNLIDLFQKLNFEFEGLLDLHSLKLIYDINGLTPDWNEIVIVYGDETHMKTLFINLIKNSIEASPKKQNIKISIGINSDICDIVIQNEGVIPETIRHNFFDRYSTAGKKGGTGIGTYSAFLIAKAHGGNITFKTSEQEGTSVKVTLPLENIKQNSA